MKEHLTFIEKRNYRCKQISLASNENVTLPALRRRKTAKQLFENYIAFGQENSVYAISRGSFYEVLKTLTSREEKLLSAVDYVTGVLVHDQVSLLQRICDEFAPITQSRERLTDLLEVIRHFLKQHYSRHVTIEGDDVGTHIIEYCLAKDKTSVPVRMGKCSVCNLVPFFQRISRNYTDIVSSRKHRKAKRIRRRHDDGRWRY